MANKLNAIFDRHRQGKRLCDIHRLQQVPDPNVSKAINGFKELGQEEDLPGRVSKSTVKTSRNQQSIKKRFSGNFQVSLGKIERKTGIPRESVGRIH